MSVPLPPAIWALLQAYSDERRSGQVTIEYRAGQIVAYSDHQKVRLNGGPEVSSDLEHKTSKPYEWRPPKEG